MLVASTLIVGTKKTYHRDVDYSTVPVHLFIINEDARDYLKKRKIRTLEQFLKTKDFFCKKQLRQYLILLRNKIQQKIEEFNPANEAQKILKHLERAHIKLRRKLLNLLSTAKSIFRIFNREQKNTILSSLCHIFKNEHKKVRKMNLRKILF